MPEKFVYMFSEGNASMRNLLGGKGANLAEMTNIGLPIPQGFTVTTEACTFYNSNEKKLSQQIIDQIFNSLSQLENITGKKFGDLENIVSCPKDIYNMMSNMQYEKQEVMKCILLNKKNILISVKTIYIGNLDSINIDPKVVLYEAVRRCACKIIIVHNHPSGISKPSIQDIQSSRRLNQCAKLLDIELLDHIVIGKNNYCSIRQYLGERNETI